jgi:putative membrane protein
MSDVEGMDDDGGTILAEERTELAINRTARAAERTLMAWVRTAISMIGFGFGIDQFFQFLPEEIAKGKVPHPQAPRYLGLALIALGTLALGAATWQHRNFLKALGPTQAQDVWSPSSVAAIGVVLIGLLAFYGVLLRHAPY